MAHYNLLAVDDDPFILKTIQTHLESEFIAVHTESNPTKVIDKLTSLKPDILILDVNMPEVNGLELLESIRKIPDFANMSVLFLTANDDKKTIIKCLQLGASDYIAKPLILEELDSRLRLHLSALSAERQVQEKQSQLDLETHKRLEVYRTLLNILELPLKNLSFDTLLEEALDIILSSPIAPFQAKGAIFLVEKEPNVLVLKTQRKLPEPLRKICARVHFGQCICGQAAAKEELIFHNHISDDHTFTYEGIQPHGHYCVPLRSKSKIIGVLNVYVPENHQRAPHEEEFLLTISNTLCSVIQLKQSDMERQDIQGQLVQSAKLASIGTLASGVAHELKNPPTSVMGYARLIEKDDLNNDHTRERAEKMLTSATRMEKIIDHLRTYARESKREDWQRINVNDAITNSLVLLKKQMERKGISLLVNLSFDLEKIWGDVTQLESCFQNLLTNSRDSFQDVGDERERKISITSRNGPKHVIINYKDNAMGMDSDTLARMFDPFFTTKAQGKGTGLGMSITMGIVESHRAMIEVKSTEGYGTEFSLKFPFDRRKRPRNEVEGDHSDQVNEEEHSKSSSIKVLIIDDEPGISEVLADYLGPQFKCTMKNDSRSALQTIEKENFDIIITDMRMPHATGVDILYKAKECQPHTPVIIMSGYSEEDINVQHALTKGARGLLSKPFPEPEEVIRFLESQLINDE